MSITIKKLLKSGVHFGHQKKFWNPKMKKFIIGHKNKIHIINLEKTLTLFKIAIKYAKKISMNKGKILFVGTKKQSRKIIIKEAKRCKSSYVSQRWLGGTLTNFKTIKLSIKKLKKMELLDKENNKKLLKKKENLIFKKKINKLKKSIGGIKNMKKIPDVLFIIDVGYHKNAVIEANQLNIPIIGIVDTNNTPDGVKYIIPGNDDSAKAINVYVKKIANAIINGKKNKEILLK